MMTNRNGTQFGTNLAASIEATEGVTAGISVADRAHTTQVAATKNAKLSDPVNPDHTFPLRVQKGDVLMRISHTGAGHDPTAPTGLAPAAVIYETLKDDGTMVRLPDLVESAKKHGSKVDTIADLIQCRNRAESIVERVDGRTMETRFGTFHAIAFRDRAVGRAHLALIKGMPTLDTEMPARMHEPPSVLDLPECQHMAYSRSVPAALRAVQVAPTGVVVLLNCDDSTDRLFTQFTMLNAPHECPCMKPGPRIYGIDAQILKEVDVGKMWMLAPPLKLPSMAGYDLEVAAYQSMAGAPGVTSHSFTAAY